MWRRRCVWRGVCVGLSIPPAAHSVGAAIDCRQYRWGRPVSLRLGGRVPRVARWSCVELVLALSVIVCAHTVRPAPYEHTRMYSPCPLRLSLLCGACWYCAMSRSHRMAPISSLTLRQTVDATHTLTVSEDGAVFGWHPAVPGELVSVPYGHARYGEGVNRALCPAIAYVCLQSASGWRCPPTKTTIAQPLLSCRIGLVIFSNPPLTEL